MPSKNNSNNEQQVENPSSHNELEQLRQLVFGSAREELSSQLNSLREDMNKSFSEQSKKLAVAINDLRKDFSEQYTDIGNRLQFIDKTHEDTETAIQKNLALLTSEHEMFTSSTIQDFKAIEQSLESESSSLENKFDDQLNQLKSHLEEVSKELGTSKTDRKTLAKLLATMATNLEDDQL